MEENPGNKNKAIYLLDHNSFEKDIKEINNSFENKSPNNFDFKFELENKITEGQPQSQNIPDNKNSEEADLDEIFDVLNEMGKAITIELNELNLNSYFNKRKHSCSFHNKNNNITNNNNFNECQEILSILKKPLSNKNVRYLDNYDSPFKPLLEPKKVSLVGKVFYSIPSEDANTECLSNKN